ncbi:hypothetical protein ACFSTD_20545 [Novosphingobium colocasiae]
MGFPKPQGLYDARNEHDSCGVGFVAHIKGEKNPRHHYPGTGNPEKNIDHRGAVGADPLLGDGAGILTQLPDALFRTWAAGAGVNLPAAGDYAVAMCFLPQDEAARDFVVAKFEKVHQEGRPVPARLARCAGHAGWPGQDRHRFDAGDPPVLRRPG